LAHPQKGLVVIALGFLSQLLIVFLDPTVITEVRYEKRKKVEVSCKDRPVCEHFYLHRFRKTCATRWHEAGIPIRTIQNWLGHKSLETTMIYLGVTDSEKLRSNINAAFFD
jgi:integrase